MKKLLLLISSILLVAVALAKADPTSAQSGACSSVTGASCQEEPGGVDPCPALSLVRNIAYACPQPLPNPPNHVCCVPAGVPNPPCGNYGGTCSAGCSAGTYEKLLTDCSGSTPNCCIPLGGAPADGPWYNQTPDQFHRKVFDTTNPDEIFGERYTFAQVNWIINSLLSAINPAPGDPAAFNILLDQIRNLLSQGQTPSLGDYAQLGLPGILIGSMGEMYSQPPASGVNYISSLIDKFDPTPVAHAQGYGYGATGGIRILWTAARNTAYLIMIVLLVAAGFMVMFRVKINPQTAVTLQLMIPKIIITLLLVTFSYAIAGFVIDLVFVLLSFILAVLKSAGAYPGDMAHAITWFTTPDFGRVFWFYFGPWLFILFASTAGILTFFTGVPIISQIAGVISTLIAIVALIVTIFLLILLFKVWWMLVKTYIQLLLYIIIAPWQIMLGLLPGQGGFGSWLRNMVAHASVFLVVPLMFMFNMFFWNPTFFFTSSPLGDLSGVSNGTYPGFPLFGGKGGAIFNFAVGYAVLALTPKIAEIIRDALKVPPFKYGTAFGEALGPLRTVGGWGQAGASTATDSYTRGVYRTNPLGDASTQAIDVARYIGILKGKPGT